MGAGLASPAMEEEGEEDLGISYTTCLSVHRRWSSSLAPVAAAGRGAAMEAPEVPQHFSTEGVPSCSPHQEGWGDEDTTRAAAGEQEPTVEEEGLGPEGSENLSTGVMERRAGPLEMAVDVIMVEATTAEEAEEEGKVGLAAVPATGAQVALDAAEEEVMATPPAATEGRVEPDTASSGSSRKEPRWSIKWVSRSQRPLKRPRGFL